MRSRIHHAKKSAVYPAAVAAMFLAIGPARAETLERQPALGGIEQAAFVCAADINDDFSVGPHDLASVLGSWGECDACPANLNDDGYVDAVDLGLLLGSWGPGPCAAPNPVTTTLPFYECMDLDAQTIIEECLLFSDPAADFYFAYNADTSIHVRAFPESLAKIAFLDEEPFDTVTCERLSTVEFPEGVTDVELESDDTVIVWTDQDNYFKVGQATEIEEISVTFYFQQMCKPS